MGHAAGQGAQGFQAAGFRHAFNHPGSFQFGGATRANVLEGDQSGHLSPVIPGLFTKGLQDPVADAQF